MKQLTLRKLQMLFLVALAASGFGGKATAAEPEAAVKPAELGVEKPKGIFGIASYYAKKYTGRRTTSGAVHDPAKLTAAHASLPLGTRVKVVNPENGREVVVVVNDRCARKKTPFIDLSREAARRLGFLGDGMTRVVMIPLETLS
ncbi:MAG TPA: septal ring lytic transglycosylase RlpA family protein [Verrucomicrobiae bacterium]|nr:septal ring lytic transglycosylase RlpA family protein [Verrucomicrobiae bacterium]